MNHRYDFIYLFDVKDGNPNGDPDAGNLPRIDPETGHGLVTDVCLKRKVRNFISLTRPSEDKFGIFVREKAVLNETIERAYKEGDDVKASLAAWEAWKKDKKAPKPVKAYEDVARDWLCHNFFDIRAFGAVLSTGEEKEVPGVKGKIKMTAGQVRGPVQFAFGRSIDPVITSEHAVTRCAVTTEKEAEKQSGDNRTMGRKFTVPYGLYQAHGFINPFLAAQTGFGEEDLDLFWDALKNMFEHDRSAARGLMGAQKIIVFKHSTALGNAPANKLFDLVSVKRKEGVEVPRSFSDYRVVIGQVPAGVEVIEML